MREFMNRVNWQNPMFIKTNSTAVAVFGHELVSRKDLIILAHCLTLEDLERNGHCVRSVVFRSDEFPMNADGMPDMANVAPDAGAITISLRNTFEASVKSARTETEDVSIHAVFHRNMIMNFLHEIDHLRRLKGGITLTDEERDHLEKLALDWSMEKLIELAKRVDIEPDFYTRSPFFAQAIETELKENKSDWAAVQRHLIQNHFMMEYKETDTHYGATFNFKEYLYVMYGDEGDKGWDESTILPAGEESSISANIKTDLSNVGPTVEQAVENAVNTQVVETVVEAANIEPAIAGVIEDDMASLDPGDGEEFDYSTINNMDSDFIPAAQMQPVASPPQYVAPPVQQPIVDQKTEEVVHYQSNGITPAAAGRIMQGVYMKIYNHIYMNCRPQLNNDVAFAFPEAVCQTPIQLSAEENDVIEKMDCLDEMGRWHRGMQVNGCIRGNISMKQKLPAYNLYLNIDGQEVKRMIMPQNVNSRYANTGQLKQVAIQARSGSRIMWVMEADDRKAAATGKFILKIQDGMIIDARSK